MKVCARCNKKFLFKSPDPALCHSCYDAEARERAEAEARALEEAEKDVKVLAALYQEIKSMDTRVHPDRMEQNVALCEMFVKQFKELIESPYAPAAIQAENDHFITGYVYVKDFGYLPYEDLGNGDVKIKFDEVLDLAEKKARDYRSALENVNKTGVVSDSWRFPETYVILDVETTGINHHTDRITEIAAVKFLNGAELDRFETLVNPGMPIPPGVTRITGITDADVRDAPALAEVLPGLIEFLGDLPIVAHNAPFDMSFLSDACMDAGLAMQNDSIDTLKLAREAFPGLASYKLEYLKEFFELNSEPSHRALADVNTTAELLALCRDCPPEQLSRARGNAAAYTKQPKYPKRIKIAELQPTSPEDIDTTGPLYGKRIVFTGTLSIERREAMQMAVDAGAKVTSAVSGKTDYLVVGEQDIALVGDDGLSSKEEKALALNESGKGKIQVISEADFFALLQGKECIAHV